MLRVALTGGAASGKSRVTDAFVRLGVPCVDADTASREVVAPGTDGLEAVIAAFGETLRAPDGGLKRGSLRSRILSDDNARHRLEAILHPRIRALMGQRLRGLAHEGFEYAVAAIPLLVETGQQDRYDRVVVVDAPVACQLKRLQSRDGMGEEAAQAMLARQASRWQRLQHAHDVVTNFDPLPESIALAGQVAALDRKYRQLAAVI